MGLGLGLTLSLALTPTLTLTSQLREYTAEALTNLQIEVASMQIWAKVH